MIVLFFSFWAFPFLLGFAAVFFDSRIDFRWLNLLKQKTTGALVASLFIVTVIGLSLESSYTQEWKPAVRVEETFSLDSTKGDLIVKATEYLTGTHVKFAGLDTTLRETSTEADFGRILSVPVTPWVVVNRTIQLTKRDSTAAVDLTLHVDMQHRPFKFRISYSTDRGKILNASSPYALGTSDRALSVQWSAFPDSSLTIPISFTMPLRDSLTVNEHIEAVFVEEPQPLILETRRPSAISFRSVFTRDSVVGLR